MQALVSLGVSSLIFCAKKLIQYTTIAAAEDENHLRARSLDLWSASLRDSKRLQGVGRSQAQT